MSAQAGALACPRCGATLAQRLDELECPGCGYFVNKSFAGQPAVSLRRTTGSVTWHSDAQPAPLSSAAGLGAANFAREQSLAAHKRLFLICFGALFMACGLASLAMSAQGLKAQEAVGLLVSTGLLTAVLAGILFSDWSVIKLISQIGAWGMSIVYLAVMVGAWDPKHPHPWLMLPPLVLAAVSVWLALLLIVDQRETARRE